MASTIATAEKKIIPYMNKLLEVFQSIIRGQNSVESQVMGQALTCAGRLSSSCGKENFTMQAIEVFTKFGLGCFSKDNKCELRETAMTYFSDLSVLLKEDIAPVFDQVLTEILRTMNAEDEYHND